MSNIESIEIVDAQIHEPVPATKIPGIEGETATLINVELAVEAMDSAGVDAVLAVTGEPFIKAATELYPDRFAGVVTFNWNHPDIAAEVARVRALPGVVAGRALITDWVTAIIRQEFVDGKFDPLFAAAEKEKLPIFTSTHGQADKMARIAEKHPDLTIIIDHIGVAQHPVSPPETMSWAPFKNLLDLARFPNVNVKLCGPPLLSDELYPFNDVWPYLDQLFEKFGVDRVMWGSDYTRLEGADLPKGDRPRRRGLTYSENLHYALDSDKLSFSDKQAVFGGTARRVTKWPRK